MLGYCEGGYGRGGTRIFNGAELIRYYSSSYIMLIPKVPDPKSYDKCTLISPFSVAYKIFTKILVRRLTKLLPRLFSQKQGAFIPGLSIFENITLALEMVHLLHRKNHGGNIVMKIDMAKTYDRVHWDFLLDVLQGFGFNKKFCQLIAECVKSLWFSVMMNGTYKGFFKPSRCWAKVILPLHTCLFLWTKFYQGTQAKF